MQSRGAPSGTGLPGRLERLGSYGDRPAYLWREGVRWRSRSYASLRAGIRSCARLLEREGVRRGTPVLIQGPGSPDWVEAFLGVLLAGGVAVPLDETSPPSFRDEVARRAGCGLLAAPPEIAAPPGARRVDFGAWGDTPASAGERWPETPGDDWTAEIVFTSGTTGEPQGVVLTHGNIFSDLASIERGFLKRERLVRSLGPMRFLTTLPLSHMFGQALNVFLPLFMGLTVAFVPPRPREVLEAARLLKPWGLFTVPRLMDLLGQDVRREMRDQGRLGSIQRRQERLAGWPFYLQALFFGRVRRIFGFRFRLLVVGGAPLPEAVQQFWERFGYLVVQGYGLTETAPIVSVSNPFRRVAGNVGRPLGLQEVTLGPGNEILVRGPNVTGGYFGKEPPRDKDGWFHTGDVGEMDEEGQLRIRGRIKDMIVTAEGENVYPRDVEAVLDRDPMVRGACVLGIPDARGEQVHAVLLLAGGADPETVVRTANERLLPRQRVRDHTVWTGEDFPRTSTGKIRKALVRERVLAGRGGTLDAGASFDGARQDVRRLVARIARTRLERLDENTRLAEDLGLASLDLVEMAVALEEEFGILLADEGLSRATVGDLEKAVREAATGVVFTSRSEPSQPAPQRQRPVENGQGPLEDVPFPSSIRPPLRGSLRMPRWTRRLPARLARRFLEEAFFRPVVLFHARPKVKGLEHLREASPPYLFVCNHHSYLDTGLFKTSLPRPLRGRIAPAMTTRYQRVFFGEIPGGRARYALEWLQVRLVELLFGVWPLPETAGFRQSLSYAGELMDSGISLLIFPEGRHVPEGVLESFRQGIGIFARELRAPVIPARVEGTAVVLPDKARWLRSGSTSLVLGEPLFIDPRADPAETARRLQAAVGKLQADPPPS
jgi:long-chain acyl-CoA synthetase